MALRINFLYKVACWTEWVNLSLRAPGKKVKSFFVNHKPQELNSPKKCKPQTANHTFMA